jgi:hypothetical protein
MIARLSLLLGLSLLLSLRLPATIVEPPGFDSLVSQADYVVHAVVKSVTSEWQNDGPHKHIITKIELDVREVIKGTPPQPLVLEMLGGKVGNIEMAVEGAPKFYAGDEDILFIHGNGQQVSPLVGIMHGRYPIYRDAKSGQNYVVRSNGMPLYSAQDVSLPIAQASVFKQMNPAARPLTAAAFIGQIRVRASVPTAPREN